MDGIHDMGGMHGFGPVEAEENEPVFHADWEARVHAISMAVRALRHYNVDEFRHAIERMPPAEYLQTSYYEHWWHGIVTCLIEKGAISQAELGAKIAELAAREGKE